MCGQVAATDVANASLVLGHSAAQGLDERPHGRRIAGLTARGHEFVKRAGQDRHDFERFPVAQQMQVLQEEHLKFDRVLVPMRQLAGEQVQVGAAGRGLEPGGQPLDKKAVGLDRAQRSVEMLARDREELRRPGMRGAKNDEQIGVGLFDDSLVRPGERRAAAVQVDMRAEHAGQPRGRFAGIASRSARPMRRQEQRVQLLAQSRGVAGIGPAGVRGRAHGIGQVTFDLPFPANPKAIVVQ